MDETADSAGVIGVIGLGAMGKPMAHRLLGGGSDEVRITGRTKAKSTDLVDAGAHWHDSPRSLATGAGLIVLVLPDLPEVDDVLDGPDGILAAEPTDLILVISSTSSPDGVRALDARLRSETGDAVRVVDAPVSGGTDGAAAGRLSIMVGGNDDDVARALPVLSACGTPVHLGPLGAGEVAKACNQMIVAATIMALGEAAVLADRSGLDLVALFDLLGGGYAASRILETRGDRIVSEDYSPSGIARYMVKDLEFATAVANHTETRTVLLPAVKAGFEALVERGLGEFDIAVTRRFIAEG